MLLELLSKKNVKILTDTSVIEVTGEAVITMDRQFNRVSIPCDMVALSVGQKSQDGLYDSLGDEFQEIYEIGDSKEPRNIHHSIWDGYAVGCLL